MPETAAAIGIGAAVEGGADTAVVGGVAAGTAEAGAGTAVGAGLSSAAAAALPATVAAGDIGLSTAGTLGIGEGFAGGTAAGLGAGGAAGSSGIFGTGVSTGSAIADSAAQGVGINLGEDVVTGQTPTPQGVLEAAGTGAAGGALTGGVEGAPTTTPTSGSPALTGGTGLGAAATATPASLSAGGGDAALGVGGGDVTAGTPAVSGAGGGTTTGAPTPAEAGGGGGSTPQSGGGGGEAPGGVNTTSLPANDPASTAAASYDYSNATPEVPQATGQAQTPGVLGTGIGSTTAPVPAIGATTGAAAPVTGTGASGGSSVMQAINNPTWDNVGTAIGKNALTIGGIGLQAANFLSQPNAAKQATAAQTAETQLAAQDMAQSGQLESYLTTGTLPPGVQANLDQMRKSADAATASKYASIGNSGSSAQIQDQAAHQQAEAAAAGNIQTSLMAQGIQLAGLAGTAYGNLYTQSVATDNALQASISNFAAALAGAGGSGQTLKIQQGP